MLADVVDLLRCPWCHQPLTLGGSSLGCPSGHAFDVARQGYVNLLGGPQPGTADTAAMVAARADFLAAQHFQPLAEAVAAAVGDVQRVIEMGAGTAYYLAHVLDQNACAAGLAVDVSVAACRRATRAHPRVGAVVADAWADLPLRDACVDAVVVAFAPRGAAELARVVRPGGRVVVLAPTGDHLRELRGPLGLMGVDERKDERLRAATNEWFDPVRRTPVTYRVRLTTDDVVRVASMGPSAFHTDPAALRERVAPLPDPVEVTVAATVTTLERR